MISRPTLLPVLAAGLARIALAGALLAGLAGCATSPAALGMTGAQPQLPPTAPMDSTVGPPGLPQPGGDQSTGFGIPTGTTGPGRYYGSP